MFFGLTQIADHPCCRMQEVVDNFFHASINTSNFSMSLFPQWVRATLRKNTCALRPLFENVHALMHAPENTAVVRQAIYDQLCITNRIEELCDGSQALPKDEIDWKAPLGKAISALMLGLYDALDLAIFRRAIRSKQKATHELYSEFIKANKHVCPFCGLSKFKNKRGRRREDFDHYLHKSAFPLAAANMKNLVPTCGSCNQDYKKTKNILANGEAFYPYSQVPPVELKVDCVSYPVPGNFADSGTWAISLTSSDPTVSKKMSAWERVYAISERLCYEVHEHFEHWMEELRDLQTLELEPEDFTNLIKKAKQRAEAASDRRVEPGQIIKAAFYKFMLDNAKPDFVESFRVGLNKAFAASLV